MRIAVTIALLVAGLINFAPIVGVISADKLSGLYGMPFEDSDLIVLMRHRAVLFGLLGALIFYSIFNRSVQILASIAGIVSMVAFIMLAYAAGEYGDAFDKIIVADVIGTVALVFVVLSHRMTGNAESG